MSRRTRNRGDATAREASRRRDGTHAGRTHLVVEVRDGGSKPSSAPGRYLCRVVAVSGTPTEGGVATFVPLDGRDVVVTVLDGVPATGSRLVATHHGGRWFARRKAGPPPGNRFVCGTASVCGSGSVGLAGATFRVTGPGSFDQSCTTVAGSGQCCIEVPADGTYTATMTHGTHGSQTKTVAVSGPGTQNLIYCLGSSGAGTGGLLCVEVADCGRPSGMIGETVEFVQGGAVVATAVVDSNGRACACLPERVATTIRPASGSLPARYLPTDLYVPLSAVPGSCAKTELWTAGNVCGPGGGQSCRLVLQPAPGYQCWPCLDTGCDLPVSDTLHLTDPSTGRAVTLARSGILEWTGSDTATTPGCGSFLSPTACPVASVPLTYRLGTPPTGSTSPNCLFSVAALWHWEKVVYGPGPFDYVMAQCPGQGTDPAIQALFPDFYKTVTVRASIVSCPPGFAVTTLGMKHPFECDQGAAPMVTFAITE